MTASLRQETQELLRVLKEEYDYHGVPYPSAGRIVVGGRVRDVYQRINGSLFYTVNDKISVHISNPQSVSFYYPQQTEEQRLLGLQEFLIAAIDRTPRLQQKKRDTLTGMIYLDPEGGGSFGRPVYREGKGKLYIIQDNGKKKHLRKKDPAVGLDTTRFLDPTPEPVRVPLNPQAKPFTPQSSLILRSEGQASGKPTQSTTRKPSQPSFHEYGR